MLLKLGVLFNAAVAVAVATPVVRYLLAPVKRRGRIQLLDLSRIRSTSFLPGKRGSRPSGIPSTEPWDGETAHTACWVRRIDADEFQVFAINCAHLGCPVRWFPQSGLFMCPCHGGVYYADGSRASGPPERGLFTITTKLWTASYRSMPARCQPFRTKPATVCVCSITTKDAAHAPGKANLQLARAAAAA